MKEEVFDAALEKQYIHDRFVEDLNSIRVMLVICVVFYAGFGILDTMLSVPYIHYFFAIRFYFVIPCFVLVFIMSFTKIFKKINQLLMSIVYTIAGIGIAVMLYLVPDNFSYYGGLFIIFGVGYFLTKIYWRNVVIASAVVIVFYLSLFFIDGGSLKLGLAFSTFYVGFNIIAAYAAYTFESYRKINYGQKQGLLGDKVVLEKNLYDKLLDIENANRITIFSLARLAESRDQFTGDHIERVGLLCLRLAQNLDDDYYVKNKEVKEKFVKTIELASTLHDIGKVATPEHILMKPGKLTDEEMEIMKKHTSYGYHTLMQIKENYSKNDFVNMGIDICRYHHERFDGKGYMEGLKGQEIPLAARIVSIVDVYDALVSERPYKKAFSSEKALSIIKEESGKMFDPVIVSVFLNLREVHKGF